MEANGLTQAEKDMQGFSKLRKRKNFRKELIKKHNSFMDLIKVNLSYFAEDEQGFKYFKWLEFKGADDFYIGGISQESETLLIKKPRLKSYASIFLGTPNHVTKEFIKGKCVLELRNIGSLRKGEGTAIMIQLLELAEILDCPISLWAETENSIKYFKRFSFVSHGKCGANGETLMIRQPTI